MRKSDLKIYETATVEIPGGILLASLMVVCLLESFGILALLFLNLGEWLTIALCVSAFLGLIVLVLLVFLLIVSEIGDKAVSRAKSRKEDE